MAGGIYYEKSFAEDEDDTVMGLVDYSSSSDDDEYPAPSQKRNRLCDTSIDTHASKDKSGMSVTTGNNQSLAVSGSDTSSHSHASKDENVICATRGNKQGLTDSGLNSPLRGSSNSSLKEEDNEIHFSDDSDLDEEDSMCETDWDVLNLRRVNRIAVDKHNLPEVYYVVVDGEVRDESKCLKLLDQIGCRDRFRGLSVEMSLAFLAKLNKDEAAMLKAVEGVYDMCQYRRCYHDV